MILSGLKRRDTSSLNRLIARLETMDRLSGSLTLNGNRFVVKPPHGLVKVTPSQRATAKWSESLPQLCL